MNQHSLTSNHFSSTMEVVIDQSVTAPFKVFDTELSESAFDFESTMSPGDMFQGSETDSEESSDRPNKKRRSWGQELPTPTTSLPPRYAWNLFYKQ